METYAFAKEVPSTPIFLPNGKKLTFDTVDGQTGYTITADPGLAGQLFQMIQNGIGGVRQASLEEYEDFVKKKPGSETPQKRQWREEITPKEVLAVSGNVVNVVEDRAKKATPTVTQSLAPSATFSPKVTKKAK